MSEIANEIEEDIRDILTSKKDSKAKADDIEILFATYFSDDKIMLQKLRYFYNRKDTKTNRLKYRAYLQEKDWRYVFTEIIEYILQSDPKAGSTIISDYSGYGFKKDELQRIIDLALARGIAKPITPTVSTVGTTAITPVPGVKVADAKSKMAAEIDKLLKSLQVADIAKIDEILATTSKTERLKKINKDRLEILGISAKDVSDLADLITRNTGLNSLIIEDAKLEKLVANLAKRVSRIEEILKKMLAPKAFTDILIDTALGMIVPGLVIGALGSVVGQLARNSKAIIKLKDSVSVISKSAQFDDIIYIMGTKQVFEDTILSKAAEEGIKDYFKQTAREIWKKLNITTSDSFKTDQYNLSAIIHIITEDFKGVLKLVEAFTIAGYLPIKEFTFIKEYLTDRESYVSDNMEIYRNILIKEFDNFPLLDMLDIKYTAYIKDTGYIEAKDLIAVIMPYNEYLANGLTEAYSNLSGHNFEQAIQHMPLALREFIFGEKDDRALAASYIVEKWVLSLKVYKDGDKDPAIFLISELYYEGGTWYGGAYYLMYLSHYMGKGKLEYNPDSLIDFYKLYYNWKMADSDFINHKREKELVALMS